jgi:hypothetical protein
MHGYKATDFAWEAPVTSSSERLVILALAKFSDDAGRCFPSVEKLTAITHLNRKTVFSALKALSQSGVVSAQKSERNANRYQLNYALCRTENGTTENGTTENGTTVVPKTGQPVVPNLGHEQISEHINEQIREESPLPPPSPLAKREAQTHLFSLSEIPDAWKEYIEAVRPDLDPKKVFTDFRFYWENGRGSSTRRSDKGWTQSWQTWVRREKEAQRREVRHLTAEERLFEEI